MGLDMYLSVKHYVSRWDYTDGYENKKNYPAFDAAMASVGNKAKYLSNDAVGFEASFTVAYWRKANAIHNWFVDNVQEGEDDCKEYYVSYDQLRELKGLCAEVLANKEDKVFIEDTLPPQGGFFFGSTDIDEWYFNDIEFTHKRLTELLDMADEDAANGEYVTFSYQSSW